MVLYSEVKPLVIFCKKCESPGSCSGYGKYRSCISCEGPRQEDDCPLMSSQGYEKRVDNECLFCDEEGWRVVPIWIRLIFLNDEH